MKKLFLLARHQLAQRTILLFVFQGLAIFGGIASNFLLAKLLTPAQFGTYSYFVSIILIASSCLPFGFDTLVLREASVFINQNQWSLLKGLLKLAYLVAVTVAFLMLPVVYFVFYQNQDDNFSKIPFFNFILYLFSFVLLGFAILRQHLLQAMEYVNASQFIFNVTRPLLIAILVLIFWLSSTDLTFEMALIIFACTSLITFIAMEIYYFVYKSKLDFNVKEEYRLNKWVVAGFFLFIYDLFGNIGNNLDIILVKQYMTESETGIYVVCRKLSLLIAFGINITGIAIRTKFSTLYFAHKMDEVQRLIRQSTKIVFLIFTPFGMALILFGHQILSIIRIEYTSGYHALVVLCLAELINLFFGPSTVFLLMTSHERQANVISIGSLLLQGALIYFLTPIYGLLGVAFAILSYTIIKNLIIYIYIRIKTGIRFSAF